VWRYEWDAENRLVRVETMKDMKNIKIEYGYFDNGNRAWKRVTRQILIDFFPKLRSMDFRALVELFPRKTDFWRRFSRVRPEPGNRVFMLS
jgi:hypothetical protein